VELGDFMAFIGAGNIVLEYVIGGAAVARGFTSYFASLIFSGEDVGDKLRIHTNLHDGYNQLDPLAVAILVIVGTHAHLSNQNPSLMKNFSEEFNVQVWSTKGAPFKS
jgi:APA family basic amino acid/polyamine antiporter